MPTTTFEVPEAEYRALKIRCAERGETMKDAILEAIRSLLEKKGEKRGKA